MKQFDTTECLKTKSETKLSLAKTKLAITILFIVFASIIGFVLIYVHYE